VWLKPFLPWKRFYSVQGGVCKSLDHMARGFIRVPGKVPLLKGIGHGWVCGSGYVLAFSFLSRRNLDPDNGICQGGMRGVKGVRAVKPKNIRSLGCNNNL